MGSVVRRSVFLTGATGFLGKVVLFELLRRSEELAIDRVRVLVRSKRGEGGAARFRRKVLSSPCLAALAPGLERKIEVVEGDLERPRFGISAEAWKAASDDTTEVIHCAASIDFHRPVAEAERANVEAALRALDFARAAGARRCVSVSTAYVTPHPARPVPVRERLAPLPVPASRLRREIRAGRYDSPRAEAALLRRTGHPNTYTLTKCLAEHLLAQASHDLPLTIVRPSIISASLRRPFPGWIDSPAAFALLAMMIATGRLRALMGRPDARIDVIPVDSVAERVVDAATSPQSAASPGIASIRHAVAGIARSPRIDLCVARIERYFQQHRPPGAEPAGARVHYIGPDGIRYRLWHGWKHRGSGGLARQILKTGRRFDYFTSRTFDFQSSVPLREPGFAVERYLDQICGGIDRHLFGAERNAVPTRSAPSARCEETGRDGQHACQGEGIAHA